MIDVTRTTTALLDGLHQSGNDTAWAEFDKRYRPILAAFLCRLGLSEADGADAAQEAMMQFLTEYRAGRYDRQRGRLRSWLMTIARTKAAMHYRKKKYARGESAMDVIEDDAAMTRIWMDERRRALLREALTRLRQTRASDKTIEAFELLTVRQLTASAVAEKLEMSVDDVYLAKSRTAKRLRSIVEELEHVYDEDPTT